MFLLKLRNRDGKQQGLQKTRDRRKWLKVVKLTVFKESLGICQLFFGLFKSAVVPSKISCFLEKLKQHDSLRRQNDHLKQFSDPTQPEKYHLSIFSSSWGESGCGKTLMLSESQCIVQVLDLPFFLKNVMLRHWTLRKAGGGRRRLRSVETNYFRRRYEVREFSRRQALVSFAPPAAWQILWRLFSALHHPSQNTKFTEINTDLHAPEGWLL